jgi:regulator of RNase E activity RraA
LPGWRWKRARGDRNAPINFGCAPVRPNDIIVADESGIVVIRPGAAEAIAAMGEERSRNEAAMMNELGSSRTTLRLFGLGGRFA